MRMKVYKHNFIVCQNNLEFANELLVLYMSAPFSIFFILEQYI